MSASRSGVSGGLSGSLSAAAKISSSRRCGSGGGSGKSSSRPSVRTRTSLPSLFLRRAIIVSSFIVVSLTGRDYPDAPIALRVNNGENTTHDTANQHGSILLFNQRSNAPQPPQLGKSQQLRHCIGALVF